MMPDGLTAGPLQVPVQFLKGVGEKRAEAFASAGIHTLEELLECLPRRYLDRSTLRRIKDLQADEEVTILGEVTAKQLTWRGKKRLLIQVNDGSGILEVVWFNQPELFQRIFEEGQQVAFSGRVKRFRTWQMVHPDFDIISEDREALNTGQMIPLYPSGQEFKRSGLSNYAIRRILFLAMQKYAEQIPETLPEDLLRRYHLLSRRDALQQLHYPDSMESLTQVWRRFKYEELFYLQLMMSLRRRHYAAPQTGLRMVVDDSAMEAMQRSLPFSLTGAQQRVVGEICRDLTSGAPMTRLVQGDVGSGKTVVALLAMQAVIGNGYQAALMAPTEILAQQHYFNIQGLLEGRNLRIGLLLGSMKAREKRDIQQRTADGSIDLLVGTHALIQQAVQFKRLGLAVVDEQHRFGVLQRAGLTEKGDRPHVLVMTATPIPRTLALTVYGDLDVSVIEELPPGRQEVRTFWRQMDRQQQIHDFIREQVSQGSQVYIVFPLVEESEKLDLKAATEAYQHLQKEVFADLQLELLHGRMKMAEKEAVMQRFKSGTCQILIATTVVEVGVDVSNATVMVIEHAERFGLSQLHQLRGRVGRGSKASWCILLTPAQLNDVAHARMRAMEATNDGFRIAEEDLRLRGSGEFFGTRQSGLPDLRFADLLQDLAIVEAARADVQGIIQADPQLRKEKHLPVQLHFRQRYAAKFNLPDIG